MGQDPLDVVSDRARLSESELRVLMPDLLRYFIRRLDSNEDASDCLSETIMVLWRRRGSLPQDVEGRRRYAYGVARNVLAAARRGRIQRTAMAARLAQDIAARSSPSPLDGGLREALDLIGERDRELVLLVAWEGFSVAEAGAIIGLRPPAARARYSRARAKLRDALTD